MRELLKQLKQYDTKGQILIMWSCPSTGNVCIRNKINGKTHVFNVKQGVL